VFAQENSINLGNHGPVQFIDPDGINAFYFGVNEVSAVKDAAAVDFTLYGLSGAEFAQLYYSTNQDVLPLPDLNAYTAAATWQADLSMLEQFDLSSYSGNSSGYSMELPATAAGLYMLTASINGSVPAASLVAISSRNLVLKHDQNGEVTVWASTLRTGEPTADMAITIFDADGVPLGQATTDASGIAKIQIEAMATDSRVGIASSSIRTDQSIVQEIRSRLQRLCADLWMTSISLWRLAQRYRPNSRTRAVTM